MKDLTVGLIAGLVIVVPASVVGIARYEFAESQKFVDDHHCVVISRTRATHKYETRVAGKLIFLEDLGDPATKTYRCDLGMQYTVAYIPSSDEDR